MLQTGTQVLQGSTHQHDIAARYTVITCHMLYLIIFAMAITCISPFPIRTHTQRGSTASPFVQYLCLKVLPSLSLVAEEQMRHELLQLLAEGCLYDLDDDCVQKCVEPVFTFLRVGPETYAYMYFTLHCWLQGSLL